MNAVTESIIESNLGRDPERLRMKFAALRTDPFAFFRGTAPLFYETLSLDRRLLSAPLVLACGDLHLENFASYKADNRLVYFDISDFDESCVAPLSLDVVRFLTSVLVAAGPLKIRHEHAMKLLGVFLEAYAANIATGKPRWVERSVATGPVKSLLQGLKRRRRRDLILQRTVRKSGKIRLKVDGKKTLALTAEDRSRAESILARFAARHEKPAFFAPIDIARRIAGTGSLGLERYVALVRGDGNADGRYLIDIKVAAPSALARHVGAGQPEWKNAVRAATIQRISQAIPPALLGTVEVGQHTYLIRELQPTADRIDLHALLNSPGGKSAGRKEFADVIQTMAAVTAWAHLRTCGRHGAASMDELVGFASRKGWQSRVMECAGRASVLTLKQWREFSADYDANPAEFEG
ncbi:MAG: DUF2252 family protein [Betaproteobacteria bacterium]